MTTLPTWAFWPTAVGAPLVGVFGVLYGHAVTRRGQEQVDHWRRREETMRMMRWSAESIGKSDDRMSRIGFATLLALTQSELLQAEDVAFLDAVAQAAVDTVPEEAPDGLPEYDENGRDTPRSTPTEGVLVVTSQPIPVQQSQVMAAKLLLLIEEKYGRPVTPKVRKLARAERSPKGDTPYVIVDPPGDTVGPTRHSTDPE